MEWDVESMLLDIGIEYNSFGPRKKITGISSLKEAAQNDLSFCWYEGDRALSLIAESKAGVILCKRSIEEDLRHQKKEQEKLQLIFLDNPRMAFVQLTNQIISKKNAPIISSHALISKTAKLGVNCSVGDFVKIGDNCTVGNNTLIGDGVKLVQNCSIGDNCVIQPGVVIGADGFAFERHQDGELEKFPHIMGVKIGHKVEICSNSSIARGSLTDTTIGDGTKLDALVHVAHNVNIGKNCELTAGTIIGGSTKIGDMCWTGLNSTLKDNIRVGNNAVIASGASVIRDVQDGDIVAGVPAKSIKDKVTTQHLFLMSGQQGQQGK